MEFEDLIVKIFDSTRQKSGILIDDGFVLTCAHGFIDKGTLSFSEKLSGKIKVKNVDDAIYFRDDNSDICIIYSKNMAEIIMTLDLKYPKIAKNINNLGDKVYGWGFPWYAKNCSATLFKSYISRKEPGKDHIQSSINCGNSGGPVFTKNSELCGLVIDKVCLKHEIAEIESDFSNFDKSLLPFTEGLKITNIMNKIKNINEKVNDLIRYSEYGSASFINHEVILEFLKNSSKRIMINEDLRQAIKKILVKNEVD